MTKVTSKDLWYTKWLVGLCILLMVGLISTDFWLSFTALNELALSTGYNGNQAFVWPLTIDASLLMVTILVFTATLNKWSQGLKVYSWMLLVVFSVLTVVGNALNAGVMLQPMSVNLGVKLFVHLCPPVFYVMLTEVLRMTFANIVADDVEIVTRVVKEAEKVQKQGKLAKKLTLSEQRQQYIINALKAGRNIVLTELSGELNTSRQTLARDVNTLLNTGVIRRNGGGDYYLTETLQ